MEDYSKIEGIIFDYGGTIDSHGDHWSEVIYRAYLADGLEVDKEEFRTSYVNVERLFARQPLVDPDDTFETLMLKKIHYELLDLAERGIISRDQAHAHKTGIAGRCYEAARQAVAEAEPVLRQLAARYPMVLVSNFYGNVEAVITDMGIRDCFSAIIESAVVGVRKPDPAIFALGVDALRLPADKVLVVGDSLRKDILPARSLGCATAWIKGKGWTADEDAQSDPAQIRSLHDLLPDS